MAEAKLLFVEDDESLAFVIKDNLTTKGYQVDHYSDGAAAKNEFTLGKYDLCLLDVMLPKTDGFSLGRFIRNQDQDIPIIYLTAKSMQEDKLEGFKSGGDDYITKPFSIEELCFRIEVFLKRSRVKPAVLKILNIGQYTFNYSELTLSGFDESKKLTQKEAELLKLLGENKNRTLKREDILVKIWGSDDYFLGRSLDVYISKLRKHLSQDSDISIQNVHGVGFKLEIHDH